MLLDRWMDGGWMDEWMEVKAVLRIAYSNQKLQKGVVFKNFLWYLTF